MRWQPWNRNSEITTSMAAFPQGMLDEGQQVGIAHGLLRQQKPKRYRDAGDEDQDRSDQGGQDAASPEQRPENRLIGSLHWVTHSRVARISTDRTALAASPPLTIDWGSMGSCGAVLGITWNQVRL